MSILRRCLSLAIAGIAALGLATSSAGTAAARIAGHRSATLATGALGARLRLGPNGLRPSDRLRAGESIAGIFGHVDGSGFGDALVGSAPTQPAPSLLAVNPATHTVYVVNGNDADGPAPGGDTVSVIDTRHCNARDVARCRGPWPTVTVGNIPVSVAVDRATDTVYVTNGGDGTMPGTVSVFNGATCNGEITSGCGQTPATVPVGFVPVGVVPDNADHTVYVINAGDNTVSMIDSATCNAGDLAGCPTTAPPTVAVGSGPGAVIVDRTTHTLYVAVTGAVTAFDSETCNAVSQVGCMSQGTLTLPGGEDPFAMAIDHRTRTLYVANGDATVSVFDLTRCNAGDLAACATDASGTVTHVQPGDFDSSIGVTVDAASHTVYVAYVKDDALVAFDADVCNGSDLSACSTVATREIHTGTAPEAVELDRSTQTLYAGDEVDNAVGVIDASVCNAEVAAGCRRQPPLVALPKTTDAVSDPAVDTIYFPSQTGTVAMLDTTRCTAADPGGCPATLPTLSAGDTPFQANVDPASHTVYVADAGDGTDGSVTVVGDRSCNATTQTGCTNTATMKAPIGSEPIGVDVDLATDTVYVAADSNGQGTPTFLDVFNGATCNASVHSGCGQTAVALPLGPGGPSGVIVDQATNTVYVSFITSFDTGSPGRVDVIDGATCNASDHAGCAAPIAGMTVGVDPQFLDIDQTTHTLYTANEEDTILQGTVSILNAATCNTVVRAGCGQTAATTTVGFGPLGLNVDQATNKVWVENTQDTSVSIIDGTVCNAQHESGCAGPWPKRPVVDYPVSTAFADATHTAYVGGWTGISVARLQP